MQICIVTQSLQFANSAGMRIRYNRFIECATDRNVAIIVVPIGQLVEARTFEHDVYIFCKTFDATALILAAHLKSVGKTVGQDLFDDYFSQYGDDRLSTYRSWLRDMAAFTDFAICSTPRMAEILAEYMPTIPITAIDDPVIDHDPLRVAAWSQSKIAAAAASRNLNLVWFGIGDNPYFPVGLADLTAHAAELARLRMLGWSLRLTIVTNARPLTVDGLALLRGLNLDYRIVEWTEEAEDRGLRDADVALLPVSGQPFSRAKSLNRAITALDNGCQVLSQGFPLYKRLDAFIYRSVDDLAADLDRGACRLSAVTTPALTRCFAALANPFVSADRFVAASRAAWTAVDPMDGAVQAGRTACGVIHGWDTRISLHKLVQRLGGLSIRSPFCSEPWNFPVRYDVIGCRLVLRVEVRLCERLGIPTKSGPVGPVRIVALEFSEVDLGRLGIEELPSVIAADVTPVVQRHLYGEVMRQVILCTQAVFPGHALLTSDLSASAMPSIEPVR